MISEFAQTFFAHPDYLVVQCWIHTTYLFPDTDKQTEPKNLFLSSF